MGMEIENFTIQYLPDPHGFGWEKVDLDWWRLLIAEYFYQFIPTIGVLYLAGIYFGQKWMKHRRSFEPNRQLVLWNAVLAIFSTLAAYKGYSEMFRLLFTYGNVSTFCTRPSYKESIGIWILLFLFSKLIELGDTFFLVVRKKKIIFLHWFHHFAVLNTAFYIFPKFEPLAFWAVPINAGVHSLMYSYYALMAAGIKIPKKLSLSITSVQIVQFITGLFIISFVFGNGCSLSTDTVIYGAGQILIYFVLFSKIFLDNYKSLKLKNSKLD